MFGPRIKALGANLRPHVKTHKCLEAARLQVRGHSGAITVSTIAEVRHFAAGGFRDITYAFPAPASHLSELADLARQVDCLNLLFDHEEGLRQIEECAAARSVRFPVFLEVDCGYGRCGVEPGAASILAHKASGSAHVEFRGLLTHAGHSYNCRNEGEIRAVARTEREVVVRLAEQLRAENVAVPEISVGSTPTMSRVKNLDGVTEARPGNYAFYDVFQASIGSCSLEDAAFSVLASVVGHYPAQNRLILNAGALALSKDTGPRHVDPEGGYGAVYSADGKQRQADLKLFSLSQEHGQARASSRLDFGRFPIGSQVRIVPNHACLAAAMYDRYHVVRDGTVVEEWKPAKGW